MDSNDIKQRLTTAIENHLKESIQRHYKRFDALFLEMITYHLGWSGPGACLQTQGKRLRPMLMLLCTAALGEDWRKALPAATSVEILHNFTLIHDDVQDDSPLRHGRPTVWKKIGVPQAINAGDALFSTSQLLMLELTQYFSTEKVRQACLILNQAALNLSFGQFLDISFESRVDVSVESYLEMISNKTGVLISAATEIGALLGSQEANLANLAAEFGLSLGLAFQIQDDYLGIWGETEKIGKSTASDLTSHKKTLPILYGLQQQAEFAERWLSAPITPQTAPQCADLLESEGAKAYTRSLADKYTKQALEALHAFSKQDNEYAKFLESLTLMLLERDK